MIIKASQRASGRELARHLLNGHDNERVEVHTVHGFMADNIPDALHEAQALSRGTRCRQYLFSVSLSPPRDEHVPVHVFEEAIARIGQQLGLEHQPHIIVFHEKEGRRHAHAVFSRIDTQSMTAINLSYFKNRLMEISRELYLEHGWTLPQGFIDKQQRNPLNFTLEQWQQAKRLQEDPKSIKLALKECWAVSDSCAAFAAVMEQHGYYLARGDKRGFVAVDWRGEVYSLSRWLDVKAKDLKERLGQPDNLQSVEETKAGLDQVLRQRLQAHIQTLRDNYAQKFAPLLARKSAMQERHNAERRKMNERQQARWDQESKERSDRLNKGLRALWDRLTGKHARMIAQNEHEAYDAHLRDRAEKDALISVQLEERQALQRDLSRMRETQERDIADLKHAHFTGMPEERKQEIIQALEQSAPTPQRGIEMDFNL
jgi:hypothetical protein